MIEINKELCTGCGSCVEACPFGVLALKGGKAIVKHPKGCRECEACVSACPNNAIELKD